MATRASADPIVIVGAGISGLSAAQELLDLGETNFLVLEASDRAGGVMQSEWVGGFLLEKGPDSFLSAKRAAAELSRHLGIADELQGSNDDERQTFVLRSGKLVALPDGWSFLLPARLAPAITTPLLSVQTKLSVVREFLIGGRPRPRGEHGDESIGSFLQRHFSSELVDVIAGPMLAGVYGGDPYQLSLAAVMPFLAQLADNRSIARTMIRGMQKSASSSSTSAQRSLFTTFRNGMATLPSALVANIGDRMRLNCPVSSVTAGGDRWLIATSTHGTIRARSLVLALPAWSSAQLLCTDAELSHELDRIPYSSSVTVNLAFKRAPALPPGFGFLVPRSEGKRMLACTFVHRKFAHRVPEGAALLRAFFGGALDESVLSLSDEQLVELAHRELSDILGVPLLADFTMIQRWPRAMAQYVVGHADRLRKIRTLVERHPGLALVGNAYRGIGISDCIESGREAARRVFGPLTEIA